MCKNTKKDQTSVYVYDDEDDDGDDDGDSAHRVNGNQHFLIHESATSSPYAIVNHWKAGRQDRTPLDLYLSRECLTH